jgi:hypothetical protein
MSVSSVSNAKNYNENSAAKVKSSQAKNSENTNQKNGEDTAAVYEKNGSKETGRVYQRDNASVERMLKEADKRAQSLRDLVEKMLLKQGETFTAGTDIYALLREGKVQVDPETKAQAQKDIAEDGYWGVKQTSERLVSFAKALTGGDPSKADSMIDAVKKGFEEATKVWGGDLPDICKSTMDDAISKLEEWRDSIKDSSDMSDTAANEFKNQAASSKIAK